MVEGKHERRGSMIVPLQGSKDHGAPGGAGAMDPTASTVANRALTICLDLSPSLRAIWQRFDGSRTWTSPAALPTLHHRSYSVGPLSIVAWPPWLAATRSSRH